MTTTSPTAPATWTSAVEALLARLNVEIVRTAEQAQDIMSPNKRAASGAGHTVNVTWSLSYTIDGVSLIDPDGYGLDGGYFRTRKAAQAFDAVKEARSYLIDCRHAAFDVLDGRSEAIPAVALVLAEIAQAAPLRAG